MNEEEIRIAATIMAGLLASSDYTRSGEYMSPGLGAKTRYRIDAVNDAIELTHHLLAAAKAKGSVSEKINASPPVPA